MWAGLFAIIKGLIDVMSIVTFIQFIQEEAIQTASLGAYMAIKNRHYSAAKPMLDLLDNELILHLALVNDTIGWLAPYSWGCFHDFTLAAWANTTVLRELCNL